MQERNRAYRRWRMAVKKSTVKYYWEAGVWNSNGPKVQTNPVTIGLVARTPKGCGCWMCANQRKGHGMHISEIRERALADLKLGLQEYLG